MYRYPFAYIFVLMGFLVNTFGLMPAAAYAQDFHLPAPGVMVNLSPAFNPPILKGIKVHPDDPFQFDFILDRGDSQLSYDILKKQSSKLIKYFLASLTVPEKDLWVNLSPYEKDRIVPESFGQTEMGRDLLAEDYMLKQITASLIYPEGETGKKFWKRIYEEAAKRLGTTNIPVNTFNKVWIVPKKAKVYENAKAGTAYVVESKLEVMLEQDYLSLERHEGILSRKAQANDINQLGSQVIREIVIPELTKEVNEDKNFSQLRQVYNSLILATWYKKKIKDSILAQVYENKNKVIGVNIDDQKEKLRIYARYLQAFKKGVYNYIKEEIDPVTQQTIPRKYFSGGMNWARVGFVEQVFQGDPASIRGISTDNAMGVEVHIKPSETDHNTIDKALVVERIVDGIPILIDKKILDAVGSLKPGNSVIIFGRAAVQSILGINGFLGMGKSISEITSDIDISVDKETDEVQVTKAFEEQGLKAEDIPYFYLNDLKTMGFNVNQVFLKLTVGNNKDVEINFDGGDIARNIESIRRKIVSFAKPYMLTSMALRALSFIVRDGFVPDDETKKLLIASLRHFNYELDWSDYDYEALKKSFDFITINSFDFFGIIEEYQLYVGDFKVNLWHWFESSFVPKDRMNYFIKVRVLLFSNRKVSQAKLDLLQILLNNDHYFQQILSFLNTQERSNLQYLLNELDKRTKSVESAKIYFNVRDFRKLVDEFVITYFNKGGSEGEHEHSPLTNFIDQYKNVSNPNFLILKRMSEELREMLVFYRERAKTQVKYVGLIDAITGLMKDKGLDDLAMSANKTKQKSIGTMVNEKVNAKNISFKNSRGRFKDRFGMRGGIDLTSDKALTVQNNGQGIKFHIDPAQLQAVKNAPGFTIDSITIHPLKSVFNFLGYNNQPQLW